MVEEEGTTYSESGQVPGFFSSSLFSGSGSPSVSICHAVKPKDHYRRKYKYMLDGLYK